MEDNLTERQYIRKTTPQEDNLTGRQPQRKTASKEDNLRGRQTHRKTTSQADNLTERGQPDKLVVKVGMSLAQLSPSLFIYFVSYHDK